MCAHTHARSHTRVYTHTRSHTHARAHECTHTHARAHTCTYANRSQVDKVPTWADDVHKEIDLDAEVQASGFSKDDAMMLDEVRRQPNIRKQTNKQPSEEADDGR